MHTAQQTSLFTWIEGACQFCPCTLSSREQAEAEFKQYCPHDRKCYLTWWNDSTKKYGLSVSRGREGFRHFNITAQEEDCDTMYEIEGTHNRHNDISKMLNFYRDFEIGDLNGIGESFKLFQKSISEPGKRDSGFQRSNQRKLTSLDHGKTNYQNDVSTKR